MFSAPRLEPIDIRLVFRSYAVLAGLGGFIITSWGPMWWGTELAGQPPYAKAAFIRVFGAQRQPASGNRGAEHHGRSSCRRVQNCGGVTRLDQILKAIFGDAVGAAEKCERHGGVTPVGPL